MYYISINISFGQKNIVDDMDPSSGGVKNEETGKDIETLALACHAMAVANEVGHNS